jgi:hypothetical protein
MQERRRLLLFTFGCIVVRSMLPVLAAILYKPGQIVLGVICTLIGISFAFQFANFDPTRSNQGQFGGPVWWNDMRLVHSVTYILFGLLAFMGVQEAWIVLMLDVIFSALVVWRRNTIR